MIKHTQNIVLAVVVALSCMGLGLIAPHTAYAQPMLNETPIVPTTAIEVALIYQKLLGEEPDFESYVRQNKTLQEIEVPSMRKVFMKQQEKILRDVYGGIQADIKIYAKPRILLSAMEPNRYYVGLSRKGVVDPIRYALDGGDVYGVHIRNARDALLLQQPFAYSDFTKLYSTYARGMRNLQIELILKPSVVDPTPHEAKDGEKYKVLAADLLELRIRDPYDNDIVLVKRFLDWTPDAPSLVRDAMKKSGSAVIDDKAQGQMPGSLQGSGPVTNSGAGGASGFGVAR